jgi:hypothetical protein
MKKMLVIVSVVVVALVIFSAGVVFAQAGVAQAAGLLAGYGPGGMTLAPARSAGVGGTGGMMGGTGGMMGGTGGQGLIREYVEQALADKLGITKAEVETALAGGKSMYQLAIDKGIQAADVNALLTEVHKIALAKAVSDGVLTQAQADTMSANMANGAFDFGNCPMQTGNAPQGGLRGGGGMMGNWNQAPTTNQ